MFLASVVLHLNHNPPKPGLIRMAGDAVNVTIMAIIQSICIGIGCYKATAGACIGKPELAPLFISSPGSTFTAHITRIPGHYL